VVKSEHFSKWSKVTSNCKGPSPKIVSSTVEGAVRNGLNDLLLVAEEDITWLGDAAKRFEEEASQLDEPQKSSLGLLAAVYRERAEMHQALVEKLRPAKKHI
jgi:hypothetical protein